MPPKRRGRSRRVVDALTAASPTPASSKLEFQGSLKLEFLATDEAWYSVQIQLEGETLRVRYHGFSEICDERFPANGFKTAAEVEEFRDRFRPESIQLQDEKCAEVVEGTVVCASNKFEKDDLKFYDAIVESVSRDDREGLCSCTFNLLWKRGPHTMKKSKASIETICLVQPRGQQMDSILHFFLEIVRRNLERSIVVAACSGDKTELLGHEPMESEPDPCSLKEMTPQASVKHTFGGEMQNIIKGEQDFDLGSAMKSNTNPPECYYFFRVANLEKDISPFCVMDFIHEHTTISSAAFISPTSLSEPFATGTIFVETEEIAYKLSAFLLNQTHVIMSVGGRPWVINSRWRGSVEGKMPKYEEKSGGREHIGKLNLVTLGTEEFEMCQELIKSHNQFHEYIEPLHDSLEAIQKKIASRLLLP